VKGARAVHVRSKNPVGEIAALGDGSLAIDAPAKLNLYLGILGKRADGFHEIDTLMQTVDLCDTLTISDRPDGTLSLTVEGRSERVPVDGTNLVMRAAEQLRSLVGERGATIHLLKRIPNGAGLGGGSSDAAAALLGLRKIWGEGQSDIDLLTICERVGSDVAFFLRGGTARCRGRGEDVTPVLTRGSGHYVLVFSPPLPTKDVYDQFSKMNKGVSTCEGCYDTFSRTENGGLDLADVGAWCLHNALEDAAIALEPSLARVRDALTDAGAARICMSGSGSCFYGVASSCESAHDIARSLCAAGYEAVAVSTTNARTTAL
jgi:4-diphosphocytidyl-2-C-methyl-D-erythritol kinase